MGFISRTADLFYAFRFLRLLTTPWQKMGAYKLGLIDNNGALIRSPSTSAEKSKFTLFHRLVFNLKRLLNKVPFGKTTLASYAAALWLLRENTGMSDETILRVLKEATQDDQIATLPLLESKWFIDESTSALNSGTYCLLRDIALPTTGIFLAKAGTKILVSENCLPVGTIFGANIYKVKHVLTQRDVYVSNLDLIP
jgi:hypothetical protein